MKKDLQKWSMIIGWAIAVLFIIFQLYTSVKISEGFSFQEGLLPELMVTFKNAVIFLLPAIALYIKKPINKTIQYVSVLYPVLLGLGLANVLISSDPLAAWLPILLIVMPFCVVFSLVVFLRK